MRQRSDPAESFEQLLADCRVDDVPFTVVIVLSVGVVNSAGGKFGHLCRPRGIKQEFTTAYRSQLSGVAERALGVIETAATMGRIQAPEFFRGAQLPVSASLRAKASHWARDALNRTATAANPDKNAAWDVAW